MRIKLDENISVRLVTALDALGHGVDSVPQEGLTGKPDPDVWSNAQECGRFLITQDLDFSEVRRYAPGTHHGLLLVRLKQPGRRAV
jgi:predicted nuclease of predicted toxin-antitoxin system